MIDTKGLQVRFGKHKGTMYTRLPVHYLEKLQDVTRQEFGYRVCDIAKAELKRRGVAHYPVDISGHSLDRVSAHISYWERTRNPDEGIHTWLSRKSIEALETDLRDDRAYLDGFCFLFDLNRNRPKLISIWLD